MSNNIDDKIKELEDELAKIRKEKKIREDAERKRSEEEYIKRYEEGKQKRREEYLKSHSEDVMSETMEVLASLDNLPVITTADYYQYDLKNLKEQLEKMPENKKMFLSFSEDGVRIGFANAYDAEILRSSTIDIHKRDGKIYFNMAGGDAKFNDDTISYYNTAGYLNVCSASYFDKDKNKENSNPYKAPELIRNDNIINRIKDKFSRNDKKHLSESSDKLFSNVEKTMDKGALYPLDLEAMPELSLCGELNLNLAKYKEDLSSLKPGERLTFGRVGAVAENGEKCIALEGASDKVSRKHVQVVNVNGKLYLQDMSLNGTTMRTPTKNVGRVERGSERR